MQNGDVRPRRVYDHLCELSLFPLSESQRSRERTLGVAVVSKRQLFIILIPEDLPQQWEFPVPVKQNDAWQVDVLS